MQSHPDNFIERSFEEVTGGEYDEEGFYHTPNGSFWDPDGIYFNKEGFDCHGGYYNNHLEYIPGQGWIEELLCYEDEKDDVLKFSSNQLRHTEKRNDDEEIFEEDLNDEEHLYEEIDYEKIIEEEEKKFAKMNMDNNAIDNKSSKENREYPDFTNNLNVDKHLKFESTRNKDITDNNSNTDLFNHHSNVNRVPAELLFNQIPEDKKQITNYIDNKHNKNTKLDANINRKEKQIELDVLFQL